LFSFEIPVLVLFSILRFPLPSCSLLRFPFPCIVTTTSSNTAADSLSFQSLDGYGLETQLVLVLFLVSPSSRERPRSSVLGPRPQAAHSITVWVLRGNIPCAVPEAPPNFAKRSSRSVTWRLSQHGLYILAYTRTRVFSFLSKKFTIILSYHITSSVQH
jgi:hypothetical protein